MDNYGVHTDLYKYIYLMIRYIYIVAILFQGRGQITLC